MPPGSPLIPVFSPTPVSPDPGTSPTLGRMSLPGKLENSTPYSGPPGVSLTGWGKWFWMMKRAVRVVKASCVLSNADAVRARAVERNWSAERSSGPTPLPAHMPRTLPERSVTVMTCPGNACDAAWARMVETWAVVRAVVDTAGSSGLRMVCWLTRLATCGASAGWAARAAGDALSNCRRSRCSMNLLLM